MMKEKEQLAIQLMLKGESPKDAMTNSGCNYKNSSREYFKVYKRFTRKKKALAREKAKEKAMANALTAQASVGSEEKEATVVKLMLQKKINPQTAMIEAGCHACQQFPVPRL